MKAFIPCYLIDARTETVSRVVIQAGRIDGIYAHLGCDTFDWVEIDSTTGDGFYVDDEGLLKAEAATDPYPAFQWETPEGVVRTFAGSALVCGTDGEGETVAPRIEYDDVVACVRFGFIPAGTPVPAPIVMFGGSPFACMHGLFDAGRGGCPHGCRS